MSQRAGRRTKKVPAEKVWVTVLGNTTDGRIILMYEGDAQPVKKRFVRQRRSMRGTTGPQDVFLPLDVVQKLGWLPGRRTDLHYVEEEARR